MTDLLSQRIQNVAPSLTLAITAKAKALKAAGEDVIGFGAGEPDFDTPQQIKQAAVAALEAGQTKYTPVDGIPALKEAVRDRLKADHGLSYEPAQLAVTVGAKQGIYNLLQAAVDPGDGVLIPAPYWVSYPDQVRLAGGEPQIVETKLADGFHLKAEDLEAAIQPNSKILIFNSPANPTGAALSRDEIAAIAAVVEKHDLWVISDEIYEKLVYDGFRQHSIATISDKLYERTVVINGCSKAYSMTGWRIGYMAGPEEWVRAAVKLQGQSTSCATSIAQHAAVAALHMEAPDLEPMRAAFEERRNRIVELLNAIGGVTCPTPEGAFYVFPSIAEAIAGRYDDGIEFAAALLEEAKVAVVPGEGFGAANCMRLSYASSMEEIERGLERIAGFLGS